MLKAKTLGWKLGAFFFSVSLFLSFTFAVVGDTRKWIPGENPEEYERILNELDLLAPDFVVNLGDMIFGYASSFTSTTFLQKVMLEEEWKAFSSTTFTHDLIFKLVPGNHDVYDELSYRIWKKKFGKTFYSFDFGNSHFVVLNSEEVPHISAVPPEELEWLKRDLSSHTYSHLFVFLHRPLWRSSPDSWEPIHELLRQHSCDAVFAGHEHRFLYEERENVKYFTVGGGGAEISRPNGEGGFFHYLFVNVKGEKVHYALLTPPAVVNPRKYERERATDVGKLMRQLQVSDSGNKAVTLTVKNPTSREVRVNAWWEEAPQFSPLLVSFSLPPNGQKEVHFEKNGWNPGEWCLCPRLRAKFSLSEVEYVETYPLLSPSLKCRKILASFFRGKEREFYSAARFEGLYVMAGWDSQRFYLKFETDEGTEVKDLSVRINGKTVRDINTPLSFLQGVLYHRAGNSATFGIKWSFLRAKPEFGKDVKVSFHYSLNGKKKTGEITVFLWDQRRSY